MTREEAIKYIEQHNHIDDEVKDMCIEALNEVEQYRALGTVEEITNQKHNLSVAYKVIAEQQKLGNDTNVGSKWIPCSERLPNKDEYNKNDGRVIATDGNRVYQGLFDIYRGIFVKDSFGFVPVEDECIIAWQPLPEAYKGE